MSFRSLLCHTVTIITPVEDSAGGAIDRHGNPIETDGDAVVERCRIAPTATREDVVNRDTTVTDLIGFFLPDSTITRFSRVEFNGDTLRVDGDPKLFYDKSRPHHYEVELKKVST